MTPPTDRFPTGSLTGSFRDLSQHRFPVPSPTGTGTGATESRHRFPHPMKGTPMNEPQEDHDDTSLPGRFHNGDRFEIAGDTMTRTDGRWSCSCGQIHDDEQVQVDLANGSGVLFEAPNVPSVPRAREPEARYPEHIEEAHLAAESIEHLIQRVEAAEAEVERLRRDVAGQTRSAQNGWRTADAMRAEARSAEAELRALREGIEALSDEWLRVELINGPTNPSELILSTKGYTLHRAAIDARALLDPSPAATTGEAVDLNESNDSPGWRDYRNWIAAGRPKDWKPGTTPTTVDGEPLAEWEVDLLARQVSPAPVSSGEAGAGEAPIPTDGSWEPGMRYYVEVTEAEAKRYEERGDAKVVLGASGHAHQPRLGGKQCAWMLMQTTAVHPAPVVTPSAEGSE